MSEARSFRFARHLSWNFLAQVFLAALQLVLTPVLVTQLGLDGYGLFLLLQAAANYLMLGALGSGGAAIRFVSYHMGRGEGRPALEAMRLTFAVSACGVAAAAAALLTASPFVLDRVVRLPAALRADGAFALRCAAAGSVLMALAQAAGALLQGFQRFDAQSAVAMLHGALALSFAAALATAGLGVRAVAAGWVATQGVAAALACLLLARVSRAARQNPAGPPLPRREFARWAFSQWTGPLAWLVTYQFDRVLLARSASVADMTLYAVPANALQRVQGLASLVSSVLGPMLSELEGQGDDDAIRRSYLKGTRFVLWTLLPPLTLLFALLPQFLSLWLGGEFATKAVWPARLLVLGHALGLLATLPMTTLYAKNRPWTLAAYTWLQAAVSALFWWRGIPRWGLLGAAEGFIAAQALPLLPLLWITHRRVLRLPFSQFLRESLLRPALSAGLTLAAAFPLHAWASNWPRLLLVGGAGGLVYYASTWVLMDPADRDILRRYLRLERA